MTTGSDEPRIPVVVNEDLSEDKLRSLLDLKEERTELDYKEAFDSSNPKDKVELAKDAIAMANTNGGYLILGARDDGTPAGLSRDQYDGLDGSKLSNKISAYCRPREVSLTLHKHQMDVAGATTLLALVLVRKHEGRPIFMSKDGTYRDPKSRKTRQAFRKHDVYVRHDDQSVPMTPVDMERFITAAVDRQREDWMTDATELVAESLASVRTSTDAAPRVGPETLLIDSIAFWERLVELLADRDSVRLSYLTELATNRAAQKWEDAREQAVAATDKRAIIQKVLQSHCAVALDKLVLIAAAATRFTDMGLLEESVSAVAKLYRIPDSQDVFQVFPEDGDAAFLLWIWFAREVMPRLYALGGYAVMRERFAAARLIASVEVEPVQPRFRRMPLIMDPDSHWRSRYQDLPDYLQEGAQFLQDKANVLHILPSEAEQSLDALCQFDLLVNYSLNLKGIPNPFPNFALHNPQRTVPVIERMVKDPSQIWGPQFDARQFAEFLDTIPERMEGMGFVSKWRPYISEVIRRLLNERI